MRKHGGRELESRAYRNLSTKRKDRLPRRWQPSSLERSERRREGFRHSSRETGNSNPGTLCQL